MVVQKNQYRTVLCAEDDEDDKELFCETASKIDPTVKIIHADNGMILLQKLQQLTSKGITPCLITLDMNMPVMGGKEALIELRKNEAWRLIPVVIYTTAKSETFKQLELEYNAKAIIKPSTMDGIIEKVTEVLSYCKS